MNIAFPTPTHKYAFEQACAFLEKEPQIKALTLGGSMARGKADYTSDIDLDAYVENPQAERDLQDRFAAFIEGLGVYGAPDVGKDRFDVELHLSTGIIQPKPRGFTAGPDCFELDIGNYYAWSVPVFDKEGSWQAHRDSFLPYYDEDLRLARLEQTLGYCRNNIHYAQLFVERELYFQAFKRMYDASREFLQALFISRKVYPVAYEKWIKEQIVEILGLPELYPQFVSLYEIPKLESPILGEKARVLGGLVDSYCGKA